MSRPKDDDYPTPPEAVRALLSVESFGGTVWEPCAGDGVLANVLRAEGLRVMATTLRKDHTRDGKNEGLYGGVIGGVDFFRHGGSIYDHLPRSVENIITNPPYGQRIPERFVQRAIDMEPVKIALLLNIKFLAGQRRHETLFRLSPPARVHVFSDRVTMYPAGWGNKRGTTTETLAWFVWDRPFLNRPPVIGWLDSRFFRHKGEAA